MPAIIISMNIGRPMAKANIRVRFEDVRSELFRGQIKKGQGICLWPSFSDP